MTADDARARLEGARDRHRRRSRALRSLAVLGAGVLSVAGVLLVVPAPELGLPLLLVGLRVLALEFEWAARAYVPVARLWDRLRALSLRWKIALAAIAVLVVGAIVWWLA